MENQDHELCMSNKESMVKNQCFMNTERSNGQVGECATHQVSHRVSYSQVTEIKRLDTVRECTHEVWMKNMVKNMSFQMKS